MCSQMNESDGIETLRSRPAARVLLLDPADRLLLLRHVLRHPERDTDAVWVPPGGGLEEGESFEDAALREMQEEVGLKDVPLGPNVWRRNNRFTFYGEDYQVEERFFLCRVEAFEPGDHANPDEVEAKIISGYRWWTADAIKASPETFAPRDLGGLLRPLLLGEIPAEPKVVRDL